MPPGAVPSTPARAGRGLAVAAALIGALPVLLGGLWPALSIQLYRSASSIDLVSLANAVFALVNCIIAVVAIVLGAVAARRSVSSRLLGGTAIGLGAATLVGTVLSFLSSAVASQFF